LEPLGNCRSSAICPRPAESSPRPPKSDRFLARWARRA